MNAHRRPHIALLGASVTGLVGLTVMLGIGHAQPTEAQPLAGAHVASGRSLPGELPQMGQMNEMTMAPQAAAHAAQGTVVRLHQRLVRLSIQNLAFQPARIVVSPGTRIVWTNLDGFAHTVTSDRGIWSSSDVVSGRQFARVFSTTGTFPYHCSIHPFMHGTVTVKK